jgi:hypothetical protein
MHHDKQSTIGLNLNVHMCLFKNMDMLKSMPDHSHDFNHINQHNLELKIRVNPNINLELDLYGPYNLFFKQLIVYTMIPI